VPALRRIGFDIATTAAFIAVLATAGMMAPPTNVPAMFLANGVNMPWTNTSLALAAIAFPYAIASIAWFTWGRGPTIKVDKPSEAVDWAACLRGLSPILVMLVIWIAVRIFPASLIDPASALILVIGGLVVAPRMGLGKLRDVVMATFTGTPLLLGAVLVTVGILVQIMTLTGVRGWLVINVVSLVAPWNYPSLIIGMPLIGGTLTAMSVSDVIGVPFAFTFIGQDMILNVAGLSAIASLSEFVPPTSIASALACYVVGGASVGQIVRRSWFPMLVLATLGVLMLVFAPRLQGILT
jgi:gluconate:H+ symporter, GntP family